MTDEIMPKIEKTVNWLREKVEQAKAKGLVVGVSGGVDSALVAFLVKRAFPANSLALIMPCKSNPRDRQDALKVIEACSLSHLEIDLTATHDELWGRTLDALDQAGMMPGEKNRRLADANLRARLRMATLYSVANSLNYLVAGTDNAAESYTGYFTKYGDGGVDLLPIANLTKREVRAWARLLGVPAEIISKAPSAGLWENQTDEGEMGITYDRIDDFLEGKDIPERDREIILRLHEISEHKRHLPPAPPKF